MTINPNPRLRARRGFYISSARSRARRTTNNAGALGAVQLTFQLPLPLPTITFSFSFSSPLVHSLSTRVYVYVCAYCILYDGITVYAHVAYMYERSTSTSQSHPPIPISMRYTIGCMQDLSRRKDLVELMSHRTRDLNLDPRTLLVLVHVLVFQVIVSNSTIANADANPFPFPFPFSFPFSFQ